MRRSSYRRFINEIVSRKNARSAKRIGVERASLQRLSGYRTCDYEEAIVVVTSSGGFMLNKVSYTVPARPIGHRLRVRLDDDRLGRREDAPFVRHRSCAGGNWLAGAVRPHLRSS